MPETQRMSSNASEGVDLLPRQKQVGTEQTPPSSMTLHELLAEGVSQDPGVSSHL